MFRKPVDSSWEGQRYDRGSFFQGEIAKRLLGQYVFHEKPKILDIGCGSGRTTKEILKLAPEGEITAIDKSESMILYARKHFSDQKIEYIHLDIDELKDVNKYTDVVSFCCLHWVEDQQKLLSKIKSALKENGSILFALPSNHNDFIHHLIEEVANSSKWALTDGTNKFSINIFSFTDEAYSNYLEENGFSNINVQTMTIKTEFSDMQLLHNFITGLPLFDRYKNVDITLFADDVINLFQEKKDVNKSGYYEFESSIQFVRAGFLLQKEEKNTKRLSI